MVSPTSESLNVVWDLVSSSLRIFMSSAPSHLLFGQREH